MLHPNEAIGCLSGYHGYFVGAPPVVAGQSIPQAGSNSAEMALLMQMRQLHAQSSMAVPRQAEVELLENMRRLHMQYAIGSPACSQAQPFQGQVQPFGTSLSSASQVAQQEFEVERAALKREIQALQEERSSIAAEAEALAAKRRHEENLLSHTVAEAASADHLRKEALAEIAAIEFERKDRAQDESKELDKATPQLKMMDDVPWLAQKLQSVVQASSQLTPSSAVSFDIQALWQSLHPILPSPTFGAGRDPHRLHFGLLQGCIDSSGGFCFNDALLFATSFEWELPSRQARGNSSSKGRLVDVLQAASDAGQALNGALKTFLEKDVQTWISEERARLTDVDDKVRAWFVCNDGGASYLSQPLLDFFGSEQAGVEGILDRDGQRMVAVVDWAKSREGELSVELLAISAGSPPERMIFDVVGHS